MTSSKRVASKYLYARILKAMSLEEAKQTLGFSPGDQPTPQEINRAYKEMAFKNHPDRGGDTAKMVEVNVAKDILEGKERPSGGGYSPSYDSGPSYAAPPRAKPEPVRISFEDAMNKGGVPHADWKFKTTTAYGGYGDTQISGFVICGKLGEKLVFTGVNHYRTQNAFTGEDVDEWWMDTINTTGTFRDDAPGAIRKLFDKFPYKTKGYNAKVEILDEGVVLNEKLVYMRSARAVSFKDAMALMGETDQNDPWAGRKLAVEMILTSKGMGSDQDYHIELIVNGRGYNLGPDSVKFIKDKTRILDTIYGRYYYWQGDKKVLTRAKDGKKVLTILAEKLTGEPKELLDALTAAASQMK
jgi:hypothetical protein